MSCWESAGGAEAGQGAEPAPSPSLAGEAAGFLRADEGLRLWRPVFLPLQPELIVCPALAELCLQGPHLSVTAAQTRCLFCLSRSLTLAFKFRQAQTSPSLTLSPLLRPSEATRRSCLTCVFQMGRQGRLSKSRPGRTSLQLCAGGTFPKTARKGKTGLPWESGPW